MDRLRTKSKRLFIKIFNKIVKSNKISNNLILLLSIAVIFMLLDISSNYYLFNMYFGCLFLISLIIVLLYTLICGFKNSDIKNGKRKNIVNIIAIVVSYCCIVYYVLGVNDGGNLANIKRKDFISSNNIESLNNIENYLIQEKTVFIRENNTNNYSIKLLGTSFRNRCFLLVKMAELDLLNSSVRIDLFSNKKDLNALSIKIEKFLRCYASGIHNLYIELQYDDISNLTKAIVKIKVHENADTNKIKQIVKNILLSSIDGLLEENILFENLEK